MNMNIIIATWNINSIRIRIPLLKRLAREAEPDIVLLQETKVEDADFPLENVKALGFPHVYFSGQKSYNGVAILSKIKLDKVSCLTMAKSDHKRHISALLPNGTAIHNFYVPAGGDIPDPKLNPAYGFKLRFVEDMTEWSKHLKKTGRNAVIAGDFNIAPLEHDVWSHKQLLKVVSHTPAEVERINALKDSLNWCDAARHFVKPEEKLYSWWSYRNRDWRKSGRGRRLDHIWVTPELTPALRRFTILKDARGWDAPSDHVPVVMELSA
ncbi:MAG: exodeoxyribonuclease III [Pseudomonadota bacterium]|nr:exodeoxyribonuclease III [Pseudomonadota bacterium]